jgi:hypothetical protein
MAQAEASVEVIGGGSGVCKRLLLFVLLVLCILQMVFFYFWLPTYLPTRTASPPIMSTSVSTAVAEAPLINRPSSVVFVPYPHKQLGSGKDAACVWSTRSLDDDDDDEPDVIQSAAFSEGICVPEETRSGDLHVFSAIEARACLSPTIQNASNISVVIAGDSYNMQLFIGLGDILLARTSNVQIVGSKQRRAVLEETKNALQGRRRADPSFPNVKFVCDGACYGNDISFRETCSACINSFTEKNVHVAALVGAGVHIIKNFGSNAVHEIQHFLLKANRIIFNSMPSYQTEKIPPMYRNASHHTDSNHFVYDSTLSVVRSQNKTGQHPFIDFHQLTRSCFMENCSYDGGHRSRYVNRWKAQLLMNTICTFTYH